MFKVEPVSSISPKPGLIPGESSGLEGTKNSDKTDFVSTSYDVRRAPVFVLHCVPDFALAGHQPVRVYGYFEFKSRPPPYSVIGIPYTDNGTRRTENQLPLAAFLPHLHRQTQRECEDEPSGDQEDRPFGHPVPQHPQENRSAHKDRFGEKVF